MVYFLAMTSNVAKFYDLYHKKNNKTNKLIDRNNITYWKVIRLIERAEKSLEKKLILDIGCGVGTLSFFLSHKGAVVLGIDISERAISLARYTQLQTRSSSVKFVQKGLSEMSSSIFSSSVISPIFDLMLCIEVIEHIPDDTQLLIDCYSRLKRGGKLVLTTPRDGSLIARMPFILSHDKRVGHLRRYHPDDLIQLVQKVGLEVELQQDADGLLRSILYMTNLGILLKFIRGPLIPIFQWLDQLSIKLFGGADIQIIAVKK